MKVFLKEISDHQMDYDFTEAEAWAKAAVERVDEHIDGQPMIPALRNGRSISVHFGLMQVDEVVVLNGSIETKLQLVCGRCADPFSFDCNPRFSALFCADPVMAGVGHLEKDSENRMDPGRPAGQNHGFARHAHNYGADVDNQDSFGKDLDITYISSDYIDLADVLTEQLTLQLPFRPLCKEDCKGICANCGADQNVGRCACAKIVKETPFSVLKNLKL